MTVRTEQKEATAGKSQIDALQSSKAGKGEGVPKKGSVALPDSVSLGVDIVEIERMRSILQRSPSFARRAFSEDEQAYCNATAAPEFHYATRFAAKEAVVKALGTGFSQGIGIRDIEVVLDSKGKPRVKLHRRALEVAKENNIEELPLSLSYTHKEAVACAMALTRDARIQTKKRTSPTEELTRQFKEARSMLDDLGGSEPSGSNAQMNQGD